MGRYIPPSYRKARKINSEEKKCKGCVNNNSVFDLSDYHSGCSICGKLTFFHPIPVGTETKLGKITSYKLIRFGIGKYRYFINEKDYTEEQIQSALAGN